MDSNTNTDELAYDFYPLLKVYKDGRVERLIGTEIVPPSIDARTGVQSKDLVIEPDTGISARLYMPQKPTKSQDQIRKLPLLVYFHGGAFFVQSAFSPTYQYFLNSLVSEANVIAVSVNYRKAPEHPLPVAYDDSWAALKWVASHSNRDGGGHEVWLKDCVDFERVFFAGDSAGANIAHNMAMRVGSNNLDGIRVEGIILVHPYFWGKDPIGAEGANMDIKAQLDKLWFLVNPSTSGQDDPLINPGADPGLPRLGCTRVLVSVAEKDFLRDRGWYYCEVLGKSGWEGVVEIMESEGEQHVFHLDNPQCEKALDVVKRVVSFINFNQRYKITQKP